MKIKAKTTIYKKIIKEEHIDGFVNIPGGYWCAYVTGKETKNPYTGVVEPHGKYCQFIEKRGIPYVEITHCLLYHKDINCWGSNSGSPMKCDKCKSMATEKIEEISYIKDHRRKQKERYRDFE